MNDTARPMPRHRRLLLLLGGVMVALAACAGSSIATVGPSRLPQAASSPTVIAGPSATAGASATAGPAVTGAPAPSARPSPALTPLASLRAAPGISLRASVETYRVTGTTASKLRESMHAKALRDDAGDAAFALTTWDIAWTYRYEDGAGSCAIDDLAVRVEISVLMPAWDPPPGTDARLIARWGRYIDALRRHERGHELNGLERATEIRDELLELGPRSTCGALERAADAVGKSVIDAGTAWDRTYDDETDHGATQGAVLR